MASFPAGERYEVAPVGGTVAVPLDTPHLGEPLVPATHPCSYMTGIDPAMAGQWAAEDRAILDGLSPNRATSLALPVPNVGNGFSSNLRRL